MPKRKIYIIISAISLLIMALILYDQLHKTKPVKVRQEVEKKEQDTVEQSIENIQPTAKITTGLTHEISEPPKVITDPHQLPALPDRSVNPDETYPMIHPPEFNQRRAPHLAGDGKPIQEKVRPGQFPNSARERIIPPQPGDKIYNPGKRELITIPKKHDHQNEMIIAGGPSIADGWVNEMNRLIYPEVR